MWYNYTDNCTPWIQLLDLIMMHYHLSNHKKKNGTYNIAKQQKSKKSIAWTKKKVSDKKLRNKKETKLS